MLKTSILIKSLKILALKVIKAANDEVDSKNSSKLNLKSWHKRETN